MEEPIVDEEIFAAIEKNTPDFFPRTKVGEITFGLMSTTTLTNLCHHGRGPTVRRMGVNVCFKKSEFLTWLRNYYEQQRKLITVRKSNSFFSVRGKVNPPAEGSSQGPGVQKGTASAGDTAGDGINGTEVSQC